jgi:hypothetical protein
MEGELVMVTVETVRRGAKLSVASILLGAALGLATAKPASATPISYTCYGLGGDVGYYEWAVDEQGNHTDAIYIDECALDDLGAGPTDYEKVLEHESGHAAGLPHSSDTSDTMYPVLWIEGT